MKTNNFINVSASIIKEMTLSISTIKPRKVDTLITQITKSPKIFCYGVGRSGVIINSFCMRLNHLGLESYSLGDLHCPPGAEGDLLIIISGSGKTGSALSYAEQARDLGLSVSCITTGANNALTEIADIVINIEAPSALVNSNSSSRQPMRSMFEQGAFITCETILLMLQARLSVTELDMAERHANIV